MKNYVAPEMEVIDMSHQTELLSGSDNPWWVPPKEKEGCETPWWCPKQDD